MSGENIVLLILMIVLFIDVFFLVRQLVFEVIPYLIWGRKDSDERGRKDSDELKGGKSNGS